MKELTIRYFPASDSSSARVRVGYRAAAGSQIKEQETDFDFSLSPDERRLIQWYLEEYLLFPWGEFRNRAASVEALLASKGEELFDAVFGSRETGRLYANVADELGSTRITILASDPAGIAIPWELLRDPYHGEFGSLARLAHSFVRSQPDLTFDTLPVSPADTFNILMVISRPRGEKDVAFQSVARPLLELFREHRDKINLEVLRPPTFEQLSRTLREKPGYYHVVHFDGHGVFPSNGKSSSHVAQQGQLVFEGEEDRERRVSGEEIGQLIAGSKVPVVLLNACQSGMTKPESLFPSVGNQLLQAGANGVVAMSYSVYVQTAVRFMARLYEGLINGEELARSVYLAREELIAHPQRLSPIGEIPLQDWMVPVLFEAARVQVMQPPEEGMHLKLESLEDEQQLAGQEIDCPEPPAFGFIGRDAVILDLERAFQEETVVLLQGMAGVGKTEVAVGFGRWWAETGGLDGPIFFFRFEHYLPLAQVCDRVGQVFGPLIKQLLNVEWHLLDSEKRRGLAVDILKQVPCLLIWDNFEPVAGFPTGTKSDWQPAEQQALRQFLSNLRGGRTKVLITSRRDEAWLGNIYRQVEIGGLKLNEAYELALRVLKRAGLSLHDIRRLQQYQDLLKFLNGNPLAIQVILPELKSRSPAELLRDLQTGEARLAGDEPAQGREQSLSASLTYRLEGLDPVLYQRLSILALFQGFVDADVLEWMCVSEGAPELIAGLESESWKAILDSAMEVGLLKKVGKGYYTIHPALPWFFHDLLLNTYPEQVAWFEDAFCDAYAEYSVFLDDLFSKQPQLAVNLLQAEEANMMYALRLAQKRERWDAVSHLSYGIARLLIVQGRRVEWERLVTQLESETDNNRDEPLPGREYLWLTLLGHHSEIAYYQRDFVTAKKMYMLSKEHYEREKDVENAAVSMHQLGRIALEQQRIDEAKDWFHQSLDIQERIGDEYGQASTLHLLGVIDQGQQRLDEAESWYRRSLAIKERIGDLDGQSATMNNLGIIAQEQRHFDEAESWYRQSLAIKERIGNEQGLAITLHQLGMLAEERRQFDKAEGWYRQSLAIAEHIGDEQGQALTMHQLGKIAQRRRRLDEAAGWYQQSLAILSRISDQNNLEIVKDSIQRLEAESNASDNSTG